eukprot:TRINITY_DN7503_c0_g1_i11.p1 TRINITY_DN7503_c0_g1~~TRINITY_DN7503_c0_g1_i11.p1  ORF type:complete len:221 (+),score=51.06 TRINITY_DN7503_c0_g1_i11:42-704(+)
MGKDQNGNHVIQKIFETVGIEELDFIIKDVEAELDDLAADPCGCRVIQKILEHSKPDSPKLSMIYHKLMFSIKDLCVSPFGNYIIQHILDKGPQTERETLLNYIRDNFVALSMNKFASNVTEKSMIHGTIEFKKEVLQVIVKPPESNREPIPLFHLIKNEFGNYVVQRLIQHGDKEIRRGISKVLETSNLEDLKSNSHSKHVLNLLDKYPEGPKFTSGSH